MPNEVEFGEVTPLIEMLIAESDALVRDRILFEAIWASGASSGLALWRESIEPGVGAASRWVASCSRGVRDELPDRAEIEVLALSPFDAEVLPTRRTWFVGDCGSRSALALRGICVADETLDRLEALFALGACLTVERLGDNERETLVRSPRNLADAGCGFARLEHDLRNVVASIRATQELLEDLGASLVERDRRRMEQTLDREWRRAGEMVLRGTRARTAPGLVSTRIASVVRQIAAAEQAAFHMLSLELAVLVEPEAEDLCVGVTGAELGRILQNLLANARQALAVERGSEHAGPDVVLRAMRRDRDLGCSVEIRVEDHGPGLPPVDPEHLFDAGVTIGPHGGSGLGLAVARELVEAAGGRIRAENREHGGARFTIALPAREV